MDEEPENFVIKLVDIESDIVNKSEMNEGLIMAFSPPLFKAPELLYN